jgi:hypothetical protein
MNKKQNLFKAIMLGSLMAMPATYTMQTTSMPQQTWQTALDKAKMIADKAVRITVATTVVVTAAVTAFTLATAPIWAPAALGYMCGKKAAQSSDYNYFIEKVLPFLKGQSKNVLEGANIVAAGALLSQARTTEGSKRLLMAIPFGLGYMYGARNA